MYLHIRENWHTCIYRGLQRLNTQLDCVRNCALRGLAHRNFNSQVLTIRALYDPFEIVISRIVTFLKSYRNCLVSLDLRSSFEIVIPVWYANNMFLFITFCSSLRNHSWDSQPIERQYSWHSICRRASFVSSWTPYQLALSKMKHSSVMCSLHTRTLSLFGGSSSHSVLNQVSLRLWSIGNVNKLNHFLSASLLEQSHVILYTIVSRIHPKNMPHVWEMKPLCATGFIARDVIDRRVPCQSAHELQ